MERFPLRLRQEARTEARSLLKDIVVFVSIRSVVGSLEPSLNELEDDCHEFWGQQLEEAADGVKERRKLRRKMEEKGLLEKEGKEGPVPPSPSSPHRNKLMRKKSSFFLDTALEESLPHPQRRKIVKEVRSEYWDRYLPEPDTLIEIPDDESEMDFGGGGPRYWQPPEDINPDDSLWEVPDIVMATADKIKRMQGFEMEESDLKEKGDLSNDEILALMYSNCARLHGELEAEIEKKKILDDALKGEDPKGKREVLEKLEAIGKDMDKSALERSWRMRGPTVSFDTPGVGVSSAPFTGDEPRMSTAAVEPRFGRMVEDGADADALSEPGFGAPPKLRISRTSPEPGALPAMPMGTHVFEGELNPQSIELPETMQKSDEQSQEPRIVFTETGNLGLKDSEHLDVETSEYQVVEVEYDAKVPVETPSEGHNPFPAPDREITAVSGTTMDVSVSIAKPSGPRLTAYQEREAKQMAAASITRTLSIPPEEAVNKEQLGTVLTVNPVHLNKKVETSTERFERLMMELDINVVPNPDIISSNYVVTYSGMLHFFKPQARSEAGLIESGKKFEHHLWLITRYYEQLGYTRPVSRQKSVNMLRAESAVFTQPSQSIAEEWSGVMPQHSMASATDAKPGPQRVSNPNDGILLVSKPSLQVPCGYNKQAYFLRRHLQMQKNFDENEAQKQDRNALLHVSKVEADDPSVRESLRAAQTLSRLSISQGSDNRGLSRQSLALSEAGLDPAPYVDASRPMSRQSAMSDSRPGTRDSVLSQQLRSGKTISDFESLMEGVQPDDEPLGQRNSNLALGDLQIIRSKSVPPGGAQFKQQQDVALSQNKLPPVTATKRRRQSDTTRRYTIEFAPPNCLSRHYRRPAPDAAAIWKKELTLDLPKPEYVPDITPGVSQSDDHTSMLQAESSAPGLPPTNPYKSPQRNASSARILTPNVVAPLIDQDEPAHNLERRRSRRASRPSVPLMMTSSMMQYKDANAQESQDHVTVTFQPSQVNLVRTLSEHQMARYRAAEVRNRRNVVSVNDDSRQQIPVIKSIEDQRTVTAVLGPETNVSAWDNYQSYTREPGVKIRDVLRKPQKHNNLHAMSSKLRHTTQALSRTQERATEYYLRAKGIM